MKLRQQLCTIGHNLYQFLVVSDQFLNVLICTIAVPFEKSWADETFSSRCWRWHLEGIDWPRKIVDTILFWDKNHCEESFKSECLQRQHPPQARKEML